MELKQLISDDDAVSPVIGVILMVAITVILAAVIASFVLGLGDTTNTTPQASFDFDYNETGENLTITHESGDSIDADRLSLAGDVNDSGDVTTSNGDIISGEEWPSEVSAGDSLGVKNVTSSDTIRVVYTDESGDSSSTLSTWEGPDA
ncbi:Pilin/Flagellin, FlaG/FlaF family [Halapricum desulfuricans]|uniref:Pilin/Flagellin, FlaG/FlaF family n=1 Tax=Halapricum desulfuricans TaxID=2841257 RepID=A0A897NIQ3_9EURY|nr:type IV pilin N-terminal domain-containing protein [Halapricum desulfuricans]QSG12488.1 Pilin/Flagellin, FlaG/FlaF family [Halapricum desulfuricans]